MKELFSVIIEDKPIRTTAADAREDLDIFNMILKNGKYPDATNGFQTHK